MTLAKSLLKDVSVGGGANLACLLKGLKHAVSESVILEAPLTRKPWRWNSNGWRPELSVKSA